MKTLVYSSINIDLNFHLDHIVAPGETEPSVALKRSAGGKGANQAAAIAKASLQKGNVFLAAKTGRDSEWILDKLNGFGVDTSLVRFSDKGSGQAIIQIDKRGQNSIILYGGGNQDIRKEEVDEVFSSFGEGDLLLINAEVNNLDCIFSKALEKKMEIAVNPSPVTKEVLSLPLHKASVLAVNEVEGAALVGETQDYSAMLHLLMEKFPETEIVLTAGSKGAWYGFGEKIIHRSIVKVEAVDTVGAGDTFLGYFLAMRGEGKTPEECLAAASCASAVTVTRYGAMDAIPTRDEVSL